MTSVANLRLPPLPRPRDDDPLDRCALCGDAGWQRCFELVTWKYGRAEKREAITEAQYEAFQTLTEGVGQREVYTCVKPCRCTKGDQFREYFREANGGAIEPVPVKPARAEKRQRVDGKAKASGE